MGRGVPGCVFGATRLYSEFLAVGYRLGQQGARPARDDRVRMPLSKDTKETRFLFGIFHRSIVRLGNLRANPKSIPTLMRLCKQLRESLKKPILNAS